MFPIYASVSKEDINASFTVWKSFITYQKDHIQQMHCLSNQEEQRAVFEYSTTRSQPYLNERVAHEIEPQDPLNSKIKYRSNMFSGIVVAAITGCDIRKGRTTIEYHWRTNPLLKRQWEFHNLVQLAGWRSGYACCQNHALHQNKCSDSTHQFNMFWKFMIQWMYAYFNETLLFVTFFISIRVSLGISTFYLVLTIMH